MLRLVLLAVGVFVAQTEEYLPISVMPAIRDDFAVSESSVGGLVSGYAWIAALNAAPLNVLTARWDRKALFLILLGVIAAADVIDATASASRGNWPVHADRRSITTERRRQNTGWHMRAVPFSYASQGGLPSWRGSAS